MNSGEAEADYYERCKFCGAFKLIYGDDLHITRGWGLNYSRYKFMGNQEQSSIGNKN